eukprot:scaffold253074_cov19-Tisochrysis_lutea.AAC.1
MRAERRRKQGSQDDCSAPQKMMRTFERSPPPSPCAYSLDVWQALPDGTASGQTGPSSAFVCKKKRKTTQA